jgi:hypothetical protein
MSYGQGALMLRWPFDDGNLGWGGLEVRCNCFSGVAREALAPANHAARSFHTGATDSILTSHLPIISDPDFHELNWIELKWKIASSIRALRYDVNYLQLNAIAVLEANEDVA